MTLTSQILAATPNISRRKSLIIGVRHFLELGHVEYVTTKIGPEDAKSPKLEKFIT